MYKLIKPRELCELATSTVTATSLSVEKSKPSGMVSSTELNTCAAGATLDVTVLLADDELPDEESSAGGTELGADVVEPPPPPPPPHAARKTRVTLLSISFDSFINPP
ncbi:hypothetical protein VCHA38O209_70150 [Vibrio chagasii]|nr:hypothetical protein VCHA27O13_60156 [Vibrio chagasii]CAH7005108.1 hypothetical protein VCHA35O135_50105 [Vibrio chagasii]CAH7422040.1 hypothetical protein VCHA43P284_90152 [Vibrio chagasii]CAH7485735.1 hypothetical protein VCHA38O209_70150 [Vibrio chagasii]